MNLTSECFEHAIEAIYQSASEPVHWPQALQALADCFGDRGATMVYSKDDGSFSALGSDSMQALCEEYRQNWGLRDIRAIRSRERGYFFSGDAVTDRHLVSPAEVETDPLYVGLLAKYGLKYFAAAMVSPDPRVEVGVVVQREAGKPEFTDEELALLTRFGPHIERSLRLSIRLMDAELGRVELGTALERVGIGVFILDSLARVLFSNPAAQARLGDGLNLAGDKLVVGASPISLQGPGRLASLADYWRDDWLAKHRPILVHRKCSIRPLTLYVLPIPAGQCAVTNFLTQARAIVLLIDPDNDRPTEPALIRDVLGLTMGEARVASLVGAGLSPREAAERLGIAEETARTILKRVFSKVGVSRQSELAVLLTRFILK
ncbi:helix-turn-helix transcriptional regulator [Bradyrhizobium sp. UFLA05-112]